MLNLQKLSCKKLRDISGDMMNSKKLNTRDISELLGIEEPPEIQGGTIPKDWILSAVSAAPGCEDVDVGLGKQELLKAGIKALGGTWDDECASAGSTITATALARFAICLEPRLKEMREIWNLLGKEGYPVVEQDRFVSTLYGHYFNREMSGDVAVSIHEILGHIDENHGLSDDEITIEGEVTSSAYQVIMNNLFEDSSSEHEEDNDDQVRRFISTNVDATQIATLANYYRRGILNLNPPWQRGDVWSPKKKKAVIESVLLNIPLPAIILHKLENGKIEVIDGQQRLRSIMQFIDNKFSLPKFKPGHDLVDVSGCWWEHDRKRDIGEEHRVMFEMTKVPVLMFNNVDEGTLRKVFNLYNTAAMKLNAAEIRNATYQTHPIHKMAFTIAGENSESEIWYLDEEIQRTFTSDWRLLGSTKRFAATELICQYFAYSRPERSPNSSVFKGTSTANSINRFLDTNRPSSEKIGEMAQELVDSYYFAEDYFDLDDGENHAFERNDKNGLPKFNKLATITNMVASRMLKKLLDEDIVSEEKIEDAIGTVLPSVEWPENQNAGTIWGYQAGVINGLLHHLEISSDDSRVLQLLPKLVPCMDEIRSPLSE